MTLLLLGLLFIAVVVGGVLFAPTGRSGGLPDAVDRISPEDGELVLRQTRLVVDLAAGYRATIVVDGRTIPDDEVIFTEQTGLHIFEPGPGKVIEEWEPGFHVVEITWDTLGDLPDRGSLRWSFRVT